MTLAMAVGMMASAAIFLTLSGSTVDEALEQHAVLFVIVQAFGMTAAMVAWMRHRDHEWRDCTEMAAAMVAPAALLIVLRFAGVVSGPICGTYCLLSFVAMLGVMLYRRDDYRGNRIVTAPSQAAPTS